MQTPSICALWPLASTMPALLLSKLENLERGDNCTSTGLTAYSRGFGVSMALQTVGLFEPGNSLAMITGLVPIIAPDLNCRRGHNQVGTI